MGNDQVYWYLTLSKPVIPLSLRKLVYITFNVENKNKTLKHSVNSADTASTDYCFQF